MSSFKKQAIKIKKSLTSKGVEIPLVSIQEILAESYGFNNRHVALSKEKEINDLFSKLHKSEGNRLPSELYPTFITKENYDSLNFPFSDEQDLADHYLTTFDDIDPLLDDESLKDGYTLYVYEPSLGEDILLNEFVDEASGANLSNYLEFKDQDWANRISDFLAQNLALDILNGAEYISGEEKSENLKLNIGPKFLKNEKSLEKAWNSVVKCFNFKTQITVKELPSHRKSNISYRYEKENQRFVLMKEISNPKRSKALSSINKLNLPDGESILSEGLAARIGRLEKNNPKER